MECCDAIFATAYVTMGMGNDGGGGFQTGSGPGINPDVMAVGWAENMYNLRFSVIIAPDGHKILYRPGTAFGGWQSIISSTIVVNG